MPATLEAPQTGIQGNADRWDDDEIALLALISLRDFDDALKEWRRLSRLQNREIFSLRFDAERQVFVSRNGNDIPAQVVLAALYYFVLRAQQRVASLTQRMLVGLDEIDQWQREFATFLKPIAIATFALGRGGFNRINADDVETIKETLTFQYGKLRDFAIDVEEGFPDTRTINRARMYPASESLLFHQATRIGHEEAGFTEERRRLTPAEHCAGPKGCPALAALSWQPIGTLPDIGDAPCRWNCRCFFEFR